MSSSKRVRRDIDVIDAEMVFILSKKTDNNKYADIYKEHKRVREYYEQSIPSILPTKFKGNFDYFINDKIGKDINLYKERINKGKINERKRTPEELNAFNQRKEERLELFKFVEIERNKNKTFKEVWDENEKLRNHFVAQQYGEARRQFENYIIRKNNPAQRNYTVIPLFKQIIEKLKKGKGLKEIWNANDDLGKALRTHYSGYVYKNASPSQPYHSMKQQFLAYLSRNKKTQKEEVQKESVIKDEEPRPPPPLLDEEMFFSSDDEDDDFDLEHYAELLNDPEEFLLGDDALFIPTEEEGGLCCLQ